MAQQLHIATVKFWQCSKDVGNRLCVWISCLCLMITPERCLLWCVAKSISSIVLVFDVVIWVQIKSISLVGNSTTMLCSSNNSRGISFTHWEKMNDSPLHWPVALLSVWFQVEASDCTAIQRESLINNLDHSLHTVEEGYENLITFSLAATQGWAWKGNGKHWWQTFPRAITGRWQQIWM